VSDPTATSIQLDRLTYAVGGTAVLDAVDLTVQVGEIVGVMGRSGTGKTTLLRLIMGLIEPTAGRVLVNGADITTMDEMELGRLRLDMGMVFQGAALFDSMSVAENVGFALVEHRRLPASEVALRVRDLLTMVEMSGTEALMPAQLSGGMRKRVGVARALALEPSMMLYDEPTAGLDPISASATCDLIRRLRDEVGVTSVVVSHNVENLRRISDRAAVLHRGRFLAVGPVAELAASADPAIQQFLSGNAEGPLTEGASH
jgi:phospholipid/cholesterol/gamma-HCH transport system ATP-binding protein